MIKRLMTALTALCLLLALMPLARAQEAAVDSDPAVTVRDHYDCLADRITAQVRDRLSSLDIPDGPEGDGVMAARIVARSEAIRGLLDLPPWWARPSECGGAR